MTDKDQAEAAAELAAWVKHRERQRGRFAATRCVEAQIEHESGSNVVPFKPRGRS